MHSRIGAWLSHARDDWFPQREVYVRCNGVVRYWVVSRRLQWMAASAAGALVLWLAGTTLALLIDWVVFDESGRIARAIDAAQQEMAAETAEVRQEADDLLRQRDEARDKLAAATATIVSLREDSQALREAHARLARERQQALTDAEGLQSKLNGVNQALAALRQERDTIEAARVRAVAAQAETERNATQDLALAHAAADDAARRAQAMATMHESAVADLRQRLADARETHREMLAELRDAEAAARAEATQAARDATQSRDALRLAEARARKAEDAAADAKTAQAAAERRTSVAERERSQALREVAQVDGALEDLYDRLRRNLGVPSPEMAAAVTAAFEGDLAAKVVRRATDTLEMASEPDMTVASVPQGAFELIDTRLVNTIVDEERAAHDRARMFDSLSAMKSTTTNPRKADDLLAGAQALAEQLATEREAADRRASAYAARIATLQRRLDDLRDLQTTLVGELETRTSATVVELEDTVHATGLDLNELLRRMDKQIGIGGPFVGVHAAADIGHSVVEALGPRRPRTLNETLDRLYGRLARWKALTMALERVPLTPPVDNFYISSNFGKRRDPFTKRWAVHQGVDMAGPRNSEVFATAPGTVTKAGWLGPYGKMVEIDHGFGITTRYGHLRRILVKKGATVAFRDRIGIMGSTGRSTSRHVHYEVRFDDKPVDPAKFIEAGRHVFKN